jgi:zinc transport system ATP-binding protein
VSSNDCPLCKHQPTGLPLAVSVKDLWVSFGDVAVLRGVSLEIPVGQLVALIGPNGSGKTTLLRCLLGLQHPDRGTAQLLGEPDIHRALPRIGYVPQRLALERSFMLSVREFLSLRLKETRNWFWQSRGRTDEELKRRLPEIGVAAWLDRPLAGLSGGQLQRVLIAYSLLSDPELLLLDEPTAGVDTPGEQGFYELISQIHQSRRLTVVLVSHDLSMVFKHASWVYALNGVVCCEGTPEHVMNAESLKEAYGIHVSPYHHHHHSH